MMGKAAKKRVQGWSVQEMVNLPDEFFPPGSKGQGAVTQAGGI